MCYWKSRFAGFRRILLFTILSADLSFSKEESLLSNECNCPRLFKPVCGSDGNTFDSLCHLNCRRRFNSELELSYTGTCCPRALCTQFYDPVCDDRGRTHQNECVFLHAQCIARRTEKQILSIASRGECFNESPCKRVCSQRPDPVCDNHGVTHENICIFQSKNCELQRKGEAPNLLVHKGPCKEPENDFSEVTSTGPPTGFLKERLTETPNHGELDKLRKSVPVAGDNNQGNATTGKRIGSLEREQQTQPVAKAALATIADDITATIGRSTEEDTSLLNSQLKRNESRQLRPPSSDTSAALVSVGEKPNDELSTVRNVFGGVSPRRSVTSDSILGSSTAAGFLTESFPRGKANHEEGRLPGTFFETLPRSGNLQLPVGSVSFTPSTVPPPSKGISIAEESKEESETTDPFESQKASDYFDKGVADRTVVNSSTGRSLSGRAYAHEIQEATVSKLGGEHITRSAKALKDRILHNLRDNVESSESDEMAALSDFGEEALADVPCSAAKCDKHAAELCDSNNRTHKNLCLFVFYKCRMQKRGMSSVHISHFGKCTNQKPNASKVGGPPRCEKCGEQGKWTPICDNFNQTHNNICLFSKFNCEQRKAGKDPRVIVHVGECHSRSPKFLLKNEVCPSNCTRDYHPVCDSHGTTHPNLCIFQMQDCRARKQHYTSSAQIVALHECEQRQQADDNAVDRPELKTQWNAPKLQSNFECPEPRCEKTRSPVCDNEGRIHRNECVFAWQRCLAAREGRTLVAMPDSSCETFACLQNCTNDYSPVCSSDFTTFPNRCFFHKAHCVNPKLEMLFEGECRECLPAPCPVVNDTEPDSSFVCDQAGETKSTCEFEMLRCIYEKKFGANITEAYRGRCCPTEESCSSRDEPVCDSRGITHNNLCLFKVFRCRALKIAQTEVTLSKNSSCDGAGFTAKETTDGVIFEGLDLDNCANLSCSSQYEPVCGTDTVTYANKCQLKAAKCEKNISSLSVLYEGECCSTDCHSQWRPVCDSRGITHENLCQFGVQRCIAQRMEKVNITIARYDACESKSCEDHCPDTYEPVCGSNGETYANECKLTKVMCMLNASSGSNSSLRLDYRGQCCKNGDCDFEFTPVCDSSGKTHINMCVFKREACLAARRHGRSVLVQHHGQCCNQPCENAIRPVCDGNTTYRNICKFRVAQCQSEKRGEMLSVAYAGDCCVYPTGSCENSGSICDSDGQTHRDLCNFLHKRCVSQKVQPKAISIVHSGECCAMQHCKAGESPVCDNRRGTHPSLCHFRNTKCIHDKIHMNSTLQLDYSAACCNNTCDDRWDPVCDQHGTLHRNKCHFEFRLCEADRRNGSLLLRTPCPEQQARRLLRHLHSTSSAEPSQSRHRRSH